MGRRAKEGTGLAALVAMAIPVCQRAERECPRTGPGRRPEIPDWAMAVLIMIAVAKGRKSKSAQYRLLAEHRTLLREWLQIHRFPARSTYFDRYRRAWVLYESAIRLQGEMAVRYGWTEADCVAVDKSLVAARGSVGNRRKGRRRGVDTEASWGYDEYHGWVYGYSYEVLVSVTKDGVLWPLLASADTGSRSENRSFREKIPHLPMSTRYVLADRGYDADDHCETIEWEADGTRTGRRFLCPTRKSSRPPARQRWKRSRRRKIRHDHRLQRKAYLQTPRGKHLYAHRKTTVEPFNSWFKTLFTIDKRAWHRGLSNNRTQILAGIFVYQLLLRYNRQRGRYNGQIKWILDGL